MNVTAASVNAVVWNCASMQECVHELEQIWTARFVASTLSEIALDFINSACVNLSECNLRASLVRTRFTHAFVCVCESMDMYLRCVFWGMNSV